MNLNSKYTLIVSGIFPPETVFSAIFFSDLVKKLTKKKSVIVISHKAVHPYIFNIEEKKNYVSIGFNHVIANSYTYTQTGLVEKIRGSYIFGKYCYRFIQENKSSIRIILLIKLLYYLWKIK
jgi:hypothetical protein